MSSALSQPQVEAPKWARARRLWREHGLPLSLYGLLSILLTWPVAANFSTHLAGNSNDVHAMVYTMWHVKEAVLGRLPLYDMPLLYYPAGGSLLTGIPGPLVGLLALPFWPWGPEAAYNGFILVSFVLTAYPIYLLARALGLTRAVSLFAGLFYLLAPMHLGGLLGHTTKMFLGLLPLGLLCLHRLLEPAQPRRRAVFWAGATALVILLTLLFTAMQFIMMVMSAAFFGLLALWRAERARRMQVIERLALLGIFSMLLAGPLLLAIAGAALDPALDFDRNWVSYQYQPDLAQFFLPPTHSRLLSPLTAAIAARIGAPPSIETAVSLSWVGLFLMGVALFRARKRVGPWLLFSAMWIVLALGPSLKLLGRTTFTEYSLPIILPYAVFTQLPGMDFLQTPGRFMQMGFVAVALSAAFGLTWLVGRFPRRATLIVTVATILLLLENWPAPWPQIQLRPVPTFYRQIAGDEELYGVFDLPLTSHPDIPPILHSAYYQMFQMTHRKGIAQGYISRVNRDHPVFPCFFTGATTFDDFTVNGEPSSCTFHPFYDLPRANYRYVVRHKPWPPDLIYMSDEWDETATDQFFARFFAGEQPLVDDRLVTVYALPDRADPSVLSTAIAPGAGWSPWESGAEDGWRWARSPATLLLSSPRRQEVVLEFLPFAVYEPDGAQIIGNEGRLHLALEGQPLATVPLVVGETTRVPLTLFPGVRSLTLTLGAGNFSPADYGEPDPRQLSFAISHINLHTGE